MYRFGISIVERRTLNDRFLIAALSPSGRALFGTEKGILTDQVLLPTPGPVATLEFFDESRVLAGGDFKGIRVVADGKQEVFLDTAGPTRAVSPIASSFA